MITNADIAKAVTIAANETPCVESRAIKILHEMCGAMEVHQSDARQRVRDLLTAAERIGLPVTEIEGNMVRAILAAADDPKLCVQAAAAMLAGVAQFDD